MDGQSIRIIIGRNIRHKRQENGLSEQALANHLVITLKRMQKYESGSDSSTCDELIEMAALFKCSVDDLCREAS